MENLKIQPFHLTLIQKGGGLEVELMRLILNWTEGLKMGSKCSTKKYI